MSDFISDEEMAKHKASQNSIPDFISDEEMAKHKAISDANNTWLAKIDNAIPSIGEAIPALGPLARSAGNAVVAGVGSVMPGDSGKGYLDRMTSAYNELQRGDEAKDAQFAKDHPIIDSARTLAASTALPVVPGAGLLAAGARTVGNSALMASDTYLRGGTAEDAAKTGAVTAGIGAGIEAVPYIGRAIAPQAMKLAESPVGQYVAQKFGQAASSLKENLPGLGEKLGTVAGGAAGWKVGSVGGHMTGAMGAAGGAQLGGTVGRKTGEAGVSILERLENAPETLGKFAPMLLREQAKGPTALAAAHYVMSQKDPEYQDLFKNN